MVSNSVIGALASLALICYTCCAFVVTAPGRPYCTVTTRPSFVLYTKPKETENEWQLEDEELEILFEDNGLEWPPKREHKENVDVMELAWRYAKKPLLRIGSKGATLTHGNSLRQLLDAHTVVKVKMNTRKFGTLEDGFKAIKKLAEDSGAPAGIELIQAREGESTIMCGLPGTMEKIRCGEFPPVVNGKSEEDHRP